MNVCVRKSIYLLILLALVLVACRQQGPRSQKCFDDIRDMVKGRTAAEVESLLGEPDSRQPLILSGERWIWWNYTYLDGKNYSPKNRGRLVHLEIIFEREPNERGNVKAALSSLRAIDPLAVSYTLAEQSM
jgi:hypothetical protein